MRKWLINLKNGISAKHLRIVLFKEDGRIIRVTPKAENTDTTNLKLSQLSCAFQN